MTGLGPRRRSAEYEVVRQSCVADTRSRPTHDAAAAMASTQDHDSTPRAPARPPSARQLRCGWGAIASPCCQRFRNAKCFLFWLCWAGALQGMVVNGFVNVVISTIERRFEISSTESGTIASCYDIASVICLIPVSYFGGRGLKPLYVGVGIFVLAVGSFTFALPHFTSTLYEGTSSQEVFCNRGSNTTACRLSGAELSNYKYIFFLGQLLHGAGASPLYTLGTTYLDENLPVPSAALYQGIYYASAIIGPAVGYLAGGAFLDLYTDFMQVDSALLDIDKESPKWVGAWWIGFLISGLIGALISMPICGFPIHLPGSEKYKVEREQEVYQHKNDEEEPREEGATAFSDILMSLKVLLTNPTFMFLNFAAACEGILVSGFSTFAPKFIEFQFSIPSGNAAQYVGMIAIPAAGGATFAGGYIVKRFNLSIRGILKFCVVVTVVTVAFGFVFLIHCSNVPFAGVNVHYPMSNRSEEMYTQHLAVTCNAECNCSPDEYLPVCGRDGIMYYSPCFAGCVDVIREDSSVTRYGNCSCVDYQLTSNDSGQWMAEKGKCRSTCSWLPLFLVLFGLVMIGVFITSMPALAASLRCLPQEKRSFGLGIQWIIARCLGSIPGPILFGKVIDVTCVLWQDRCGGEGACYFYNNMQMSYNLLAIGLVFIVLSVVFFVLALVFYRTKPCADGQHVLTVAANGSSMHSSMTTLTLGPTPASTPTSDIPFSSIGDQSLDDSSLVTDTDAQNWQKTYIPTQHS